MIHFLLKSEIFLIVISGVAIFAIQQVIVELWIKPYIEFRKTVEQIDCFLFEYNHTMFLVPVLDRNNQINKDIQEVQQRLRTLAARLFSQYNTLIFIERCWLRYTGQYEITMARDALVVLAEYIGKYEKSNEIMTLCAKVQKGLKLKTNLLVYR